MTPSDYRAGGTRRDDPLRGRRLLARRDPGRGDATRGVCAILLGDDPEALVRDLQDRFPNGRARRRRRGFREDGRGRWSAWSRSRRGGFDLPLDIRGTAFQQRVWQALRKIPAGTTASYAEIAARSARRRRAGGRARLRRQRARGRHPLPPGGAGRRRALRLPLGHRAKARAARTGGGRTGEGLSRGFPSSPRGRLSPRQRGEGMGGGSGRDRLASATKVRTLSPPSGIRVSPYFPNRSNFGKLRVISVPASARWPIHSPAGRLGEPDLTGAVAPGQALGEGEDVGVAQRALAAALQAHALAARHLGQLGEREDQQQLAVLADDRDVVAASAGTQQRRLGRRRRRSARCLPLRVLATSVVLRRDEAAPVESRRAAACAPGR